MNPARVLWLPRTSLLVLVHFTLLVLPPWPEEVRVILVLASFALYPPLILQGLRQALRGTGLTPMEALRRPANAVSAARPLLVLGGAALVLGGPKGATTVAGAILVATGFALDSLDGALARTEASEASRAPSPSHPAARLVGPWLDAEADALVIYLAGLPLVVLGLAPPYFAIPLLARYGFGLLFALVPMNPPWPRWYRWFSKGAAAVLQTAVALGYLALVLPSPLSILSTATMTLATLLISASFVLETAYRLAFVPRILPPGHPGLVRSLLVYYLVPWFLMPWRHHRLVHFYRQFIKPGDLVYDVGSHLGNRIAIFLELGARVRAFEPQAACLPLLRHWYGREPRVVLRPVALGATPSQGHIQLSTRHPTLSTLDPAWAQARKESPDFSGIHWDREEPVTISTLDQEIAESGHPAFIKIDVEGFEPFVLQGLSQPIPGLSFEYLPGEPQRTLTCLDHLDNLGPRRYLFSPGESMVPDPQGWLSSPAIRAWIHQGRAGEPSGDIYALIPPKPPADSNPGPRAHKSPKAHKNPRNTFP